MKDAPQVERDRFSEMLVLGSWMWMSICLVSLMWTFSVWPWRSVILDSECVSVKFSWSLEVGIVD
jgi:hypothetical protein